MAQKMQQKLIERWGRSTAAKRVGDPVRISAVQTLIVPKNDNSFV